MRVSVGLGGCIKAIVSDLLPACMLQDIEQAPVAQLTHVADVFCVFMFQFLLLKRSSLSSCPPHRR